MSLLLGFCRKCRCRCQDSSLLNILMSFPLRYVTIGRLAGPFALPLASGAAFTLCSVMAVLSYTGAHRAQGSLSSMSSTVLVTICGFNNRHSYWNKIIFCFDLHVPIYQ